MVRKNHLKLHVNSSPTPYQIQGDVDNDFRSYPAPCRLRAYNTLKLQTVPATHPIACSQLLTVSTTWPTAFLLFSKVMPSSALLLQLAPNCAFSIAWTEFKGKSEIELKDGPSSHKNWTQIRHQTSPRSVKLSQRGFLKQYRPNKVPTITWGKKDTDKYEALLK